MPLQRPVRVGRFEPEVADAVVRWGPVSVITARTVRPRIIVEEGMVVATLFRTEPRC